MSSFLQCSTELLNSYYFVKQKKCKRGLLKSKVLTHGWTMHLTSNLVSNLHPPPLSKPTRFHQEEKPRAEHLPPLFKPPPECQGPATSIALLPASSLPHRRETRLVSQSFPNTLCKAARSFMQTAAKQSTVQKPKADSPNCWAGHREAEGVTEGPQAAADGQHPADHSPIQLLLHVQSQEPRALPLWLGFSVSFQGQSSCSFPLAGSFCSTEGNTRDVGAKE